MRKILVALATTAVLATSAQAQTTNQVIGTVLGVAIGSQIGPFKGQDRAAVMVLGGIIGNEIGRPAPVQPRMDNGYPPVYGNGAPPVYQHGGYATRNSTVPVQYAPAQPQYEMPFCDNQYYEGQYNPGMAQAYCQGQRIRIMREMQRQQAEAYQRGANGY